MRNQLRIKSKKGGQRKRGGVGGEQRGSRKRRGIDQEGWWVVLGKLTHLAGWWRQLNEIRPEDVCRLLLLSCFGCCFMRLHALVITYLQYSSDQQGSDSTHSQCIQNSSSPLEPNLGHSCRTLSNHMLCQCSSQETHSGEPQGNHSQLKRLRVQFHELNDYYHYISHLKSKLS